MDSAWDSAGALLFERSRHDQIIISPPRSIAKLAECVARRGGRVTKRVWVRSTANEANEEVALASGDCQSRVSHLSRVADGRPSSLACGHRCGLKVRSTAVKVGRVVEENVEAEDGAVGVHGELALFASQRRVAHVEAILRTRVARR